MSAWWRQAASLVARGEVSVLVAICSITDSAPREAGTKMLVWKEGQEGTVGGGNLEFTIADQARKMLGCGTAHRFQSYPLGPLLGQCCGGRVGILLERIDGRSIAWLDAIRDAEDASHPYAIHSTLEEAAIARRIVDLSGTTELRGDADPVHLTGSDGKPVDPGARFDPVGLSIVERVDPRPLLLMFGAGHVGKALAPILATLPFRLAWYDNRDELGGSGATIASDLVARVEAAAPGALYLVFTQSHSVDYELTRAVLRRGDFRYCGLIGSRTKRARFEKRLRADGIARIVLSRLICPIGSIGLTSKTPQVLAIAIAAELLLTVQSRVEISAHPPKAIHGS